MLYLSIWREMSFQTQFSKYWHCCLNDKIFNKFTISERDDVALKTLLDDFEKNNLRFINDRFKRDLDELLWKFELNDVKSTFQKSRYKKIEQCKDFHELIVIYNNVFSFCNETTKMNYKHNDFNVSLHEKNQTFNRCFVCNFRWCV